MFYSQDKQDEYLEKNIFKSYKSGIYVDVGSHNNYDDVSIPIIDYLTNKNYIIIHKSIDIFMINKKSVFYNN